MNDLTKPSLQIDLYANVPKIDPIEHNLGAVEEYAIQLKKFYNNLVFDERQYTQAKDERAKVNNLVKKIAETRKETMKLYNEPISDFENTCKRIEKLLGESASIIDNSVKKFDSEAQEVKRTKINALIEEIREQYIKDYPDYTSHFKDLFIVFDNRWFNKTYKDNDLTNDIKIQFNEKLEDVQCFAKDVEIMFEYIDDLDKEHLLNKEVYLERYKHTRNMTEIINNIKEDLNAKQKVEEKDPFAGLTVSDVEAVPILPFKLLFMANEEQVKKVMDFAKSIGIKKIEKEIL